MKLVLEAGCLLVFFALVPVNEAFSAELTAGPSARVCAAQADGYLGARLAIWQQRLNLQNWNISLAMSHPSDLKPKTLGNIHWDSSKKSAVIRVLDASDYQASCREALRDMEMTVVHELVHLELASLPRPPASRRDEELAVDRIADALVHLDRQRDQN